MNVLSINCGSSSLKLRLVEIDARHATPLAEGAVEAIGPNAVVVFQTSGGPSVRNFEAIGDHGAALNRLLSLLGEEQRQQIDAVGHRVVHGGALLQPEIINDEILQAIDAARRFAPLHNGPSLEGIRAAQQHLHDVPMVAVFDTAFHGSMPAVAANYALPQELTIKHGLRRYGYHGIAHRSMAERYVELTQVPQPDVSIVTLQLGNGCSATAVQGGASIDTSMGFTPLEGLVMGTRPGDVDPSIVTYLQREQVMSPGDIDQMLNHSSGLLGMSGSSADMAALLDEEAQGYPRAHDAIELFCYRVRKYIGAYLAVLGQVQAVVFGGGIGERAPEIRRRICEPLRLIGLRIDAARNAALGGGEGKFSSDSSPIAAYVIPSDEQRIIARDTFDLLSRPHEHASLSTL
jgi:acetate kinase